MDEGDDKKESASGGGGSSGVTEESRSTRTRRGVLIGGGGAAAVLAAGAAAWWAIGRDGDPTPPGGEAPATSIPTCVEERELPATFAEELEENAPLELTAESLERPFRAVSLQDVAHVPANDDGAERLVLTQHGATAQIQFVAVDGSEDPIVHSIDYGVNPGVAVSEDGVCWFVTREAGHVLSIGPDLRELRDLGAVSKEATSLYSPVIGSGGTVFGGSYPTGAIWTADRESGAFTLGPRIGDNQYVRSLAVVGDRVFAGTGGEEPMLIEVDVSTLGASAEYEVPGVRAGGSVSRLVTLPGQRLLVYRDEEDGGSDGVTFDPSTGEFGSELSPGASSRSFALSGEETFFVAGNEVKQWGDGSDGPQEAGTSAIENPVGVVSLKDDTVLAVGPNIDGSPAIAVAPISPVGEIRDVRIEPSAHDITAVIPLPATGHLAIGGYQGDGLVVIDLDGTEIAHTRRGTGVQQVEGGIEGDDGLILVGSYGEGRVHANRTEEGSDILATRLVADLGVDLHQARPVAWSRLGDGFAVGTVPEQGRLGGVLQVLENSEEGLVPGIVLEDPAEGLSIVGVAEVADGEVVLTTSVRGGYGIAPEKTEASVLRVAVADGGVLWITSVPAADVYTPIVQQDRVFCGTTSGVLVLDLETGELLADLRVGEPAEKAGYTAARLEPWEVEGRFLHSSRGSLTLVDAVDGTLRRGSDGVGSPLGRVGSAIYAASGSELLRFPIPGSEGVETCE